MPVRPPRVYIQRFNTTQVRVESPATNRLARDGEVFFDPATRSLRMGDGVTAGGNILATADGLQTNQLVNDEAALVLEADGDIVIQGTIRDESGVDLLAAANGAPALPTASSTVKGGIKVGANLSIDGDGVLNAEDGNYTLPTASDTVKGGVKLGEGFSLDVTDKVTTNKLYNSDLTQPSQHYRLTLTTTGTITLPDNSEILGATLKTIYGAETYAGITAGPDAAHSEESWVWVDASGATIATKYSTDSYQWKFDNSGNLTLPEGGSIVDSNGDPIVNTADFAFDTTDTRSTLYIGTNGANATMSLSTSGAEGSSYIEIPGDNNTGDGLNIYNTGTDGRIYARAQELVEFESNNSDILLSTDGGTWRFRKDALLEFPNGSKQHTAAYPAGSVTFETISYADDYADPIAAGMTDLQLELNEYNQDDERYFLELPFNIKSFGRTINAITLSSNAYIDFETAVDAAGHIPNYNGGEAQLIDAERVPLLCIFGRDGGWQKVYTKQLTSPNRFVVRFEGDPTHAGYQATSTLKYNIVFYQDSDQMDLYIVDNSGGFPSLAFISDSWTNLGEFGNSQGNAYTIRTSPYLYDADGNITLSGGARISTSGYNSDSLVTNVFAKGDQYAGLDWKGTNTVYVGPSGIDVYTNSSGSAYEEGSESLWNFGAGGNLSLPNGNIIGGAEITPVEDNTTTITNYAYDATGTTVGLTSGDTVDFPNFSGSILVNSYNGGGVTQYLCGGGTGNATAVGSSKGADVGSMDANSGIGGYTFTANETGEHCFYVIRTRTGA